MKKKFAKTECSIHGNSQMETYLKMATYMKHYSIQPAWHLWNTKRECQSDSLKHIEPNFIPLSP